MSCVKHKEPQPEQTGISESDFNEKLDPGTPEQKASFSLCGIEKLSKSACSGHQLENCQFDREATGSKPAKSQADDTKRRMLARQQTCPDVSVSFSHWLYFWTQTFIFKMMSG